ncbi:MAG: hypothetical protein NTX93_11190 [Bacteroidia bacterium]|nr:hypothetical protein [Bacteroidia bacterium]
MRNQFSRYFIKTGKLDKKYGKLLVQLYDNTYTQCGVMWFTNVSFPN